jgi:hypothetical protein
MVKATESALSGVRKGEIGHFGVLKHAIPGEYLLISLCGMLAEVFLLLAVLIGSLEKMWKLCQR